MKDFRVTKNVKEIKFEGVWGKLESNKLFPKTITHKIFETKFSFDVRFLLVLTKLSFGLCTRILSYEV